MRKNMHVILFAGCICAALSGCGSTDAKAEYDYTEIAQSQTVPAAAFEDAEITIPAGLAGDEVSDSSIAYVDERTATVTYSLSAQERSDIVNRLSEEITESISVILNDKDHYPDIISISANTDYTEFTITLSGGNMNTYESMLAMSFYIVGNKYQIYNGTAIEEAVTVVRYIDSDSGAVISETDSTSMQNG